MCSLFANLCSTKFTVDGSLDQSNSPARRPHLTSSIASTFDADKRDLASVMVWPTAEKSRSDCAELADIQRRRRATWDRMGKSFSCSFQYCSGLALAAGTRSAMYRASSSVTDRLDWLGAVDVASDPPSRRSTNGSTRGFFFCGPSSTSWSLQHNDSSKCC